MPFFQLLSPSFRASWGLSVVAPGADGRMVFTFDKISLVKGQVFRMYFYEKGGARNLVVTVDGRDMMRLLLEV